MQHLTRWRTVTAAATTAALAAGAFGIANAVSSNVEQPAAIELATDVTGDDLPVVDDSPESAVSVDSQVSPTTASANEPSAIVPPTPPSVDSAAEANEVAADGAITPVPVPDSSESPESTPSPGSPDSPDTQESPGSTQSPDDEPSPMSAVSVDSPESTESPDDEPSEDSPDSVDSAESVDSAD